MKLQNYHEAEYYSSRFDGDEGDRKPTYNKREFSLAHDRCPVQSCGGHLVLMKSRTGRLFFGCSNYPACDGSIRMDDPKVDVKYWYEKSLKYGRWPHIARNVDIDKIINRKHLRRHKR